MFFAYFPYFAVLSIFHLGMVFDSWSFLRLLWLSAFVRRGFGSGYFESISMREPGSAQVNSHGGNGGIGGLSTEGNEANKGGTGEGCRRKEIRNLNAPPSSPPALRSGATGDFPPSQCAPARRVGAASESRRKVRLLSRVERAAHSQAGLSRDVPA